MRARRAPIQRSIPVLSRLVWGEWRGRWSLRTAPRMAPRRTPPRVCLPRATLYLRASVLSSYTQPYLHARQGAQPSFPCAFQAHEILPLEHLRDHKSWSLSQMWNHPCHRHRVAPSPLAILSQYPHDGARTHRRRDDPLDHPAAWPNQARGSARKPAARQAEYCKADHHQALPPNFSAEVVAVHPAVLLLLGGPIRVNGDGAPFFITTRGPLIGLLPNRTVAAIAPSIAFRTSRWQITRSTEIKAYLVVQGATLVIFCSLSGKSGQSMLRQPPGRALASSPGFLSG